MTEKEKLGLEGRFFKQVSRWLESGLICLKSDEQPFFQADNNRQGALVPLLAASLRVDTQPRPEIPLG